MLEHFDSKARWAKLRIIGNSHLAQATIAVPILGYFILFNAHLLDWLRIHTDFCQGPSCSVSWRLYFIYFGCFFVAIGAILYGIFCPNVIKQYGGASEFFEAEKTYFSAPKNLGYLFAIIESEKGEPVDDPFNLKQIIVQRNAAINVAHTPALADIMGEYYVLMNVSSRTIRAASLSAYCLGFALLLIPTVFTFFQVAIQAFRHLVAS